MGRNFFYIIGIILIFLVSIECQRLKGSLELKNLKPKHLFTSKNKLSWVYFVQSNDVLTLTSVMIKPDETLMKGEFNITGMDWSVLLSNEDLSCFMLSKNNNQDLKLFKVQGEVITELTKKASSIKADGTGKLEGVLGKMCSKILANSKIYQQGNTSFTEITLPGSLNGYDPNLNYIVSNGALFEFKMNSMMYTSLKNESLYTNNKIMCYNMSNIMRLMILSTDITENQGTQRSVKLLVVKIEGGVYKNIGSFEDLKVIKDPTLIRSSSLSIFSLKTIKGQFQGSVNSQIIDYITGTYKQFNIIQEWKSLNENSFKILNEKFALCQISQNEMKTQMYYQIKNNKMIKIGIRQIDQKTVNIRSRFFIDQTGMDIMILSQYRTIDSQNFINANITIIQQMGRLPPSQIMFPGNMILNTSFINIQPNTFISLKNNFNWLHLQKYANNKTVIRYASYNYENNSGLMKDMLELQGTWMPINQNIQTQDCGILISMDTGKIKFIHSSNDKKIVSNSDPSPVFGNFISSPQDFFMIGSMCKSIAFNKKIFMEMNNEYKEIALPVEMIAVDVMFQYAIGIDNNLYKFDSLKSQYTKIADSIKNYQFTNIFCKREQGYDKIIIVSRQKMGDIGTSRKFLTIVAKYKPDANQFSIIETIQKDQIISDPLLFINPTLDLFNFVLPTAQAVQNVPRIINYETSQINEFQIPEQLLYTQYDFQVKINGKYIFIHPIIKDWQKQDQKQQNKPIEEKYYKVENKSMILVGKKPIDPILEKARQKSLIFQKNNELFVVTQYLTMKDYQFNQFKITLIQEKGSIPPPKPKIKIPSLFKFSFQNLKKNRFYSTKNRFSWFYFELTEENKTFIKSVSYDFSKQADKVVDSTLQIDGKWEPLIGNQESQDCALLYSIQNDSTKFFYQNSDKKLALQPDPTQILMNNYGQFIRLGKMCKSFKVGDKVYFLKDSKYQQVVSETKLMTFDQGYQYAIGQDGYLFKLDIENLQYIRLQNVNASQKTKIKSLSIQDQDRIVITSLDDNDKFGFTANFKAFRYLNNSLTKISELSQVGMNQFLFFQISQTLRTFMFGYKAKNQRKIVMYNIDFSQQNSEVEISIPDYLQKQTENIRFAIKLTDIFVLIRLQTKYGRKDQYTQQIYYQIINNELQKLNYRQTTQTQDTWQKSLIYQQGGDMTVVAQYQSFDNFQMTSGEVILVQVTVGSVLIQQPTISSEYDMVSSGFTTVASEMFMCMTGCNQCSQLTACDVCLSGYSNVNSICVKCNQLCKTCSQNDQNICLSCFSGFILYNKSCTTCNQTCQTCSTSDPNFCLSCNMGLVSINGICTACPDSCLKCDLNLTCLQCQPGFALRKGQCVECLSSCSICQSQIISNCLKCKDGFQLDTQNNKCKKCMNGCLTCSQGKCLKCMKQYKNKQGSCISKCAYPCLTCETGSSANCTSCFAGFTLNNTNKVCNFNSSCNSTSSCKTCDKNFTLQNSKCIACNAGAQCQRCHPRDINKCTQCSNGYYLSKKQCLKCPQSCLSCLNPQTCGKCKPGYVLKGQKCVNCQSPCKTCSSKPEVCDQCLPGYTLAGWKCVSNIGVQFQIKLNLNYVDFFNLYSEFRDSLTKFMTQVTGKINKKCLTFKSIVNGSTVATGVLSAGNQQQSQNVLTNMINSLNAGSTLNGVQILSSSINGVGFTRTAEENPQIGRYGNTVQQADPVAIALVVTLPVLLISIAGAIFAYHHYKKSQSNVSPKGQGNQQQMAQKYEEGPAANPTASNFMKNQETLNENYIKRDREQSTLYGLKKY